MKCKTCKAYFKSKASLDNHWLSCWEKNQGKKFFDLIAANNVISKKHKTPVPKLATEKNIKFERNKSTIKAKETKNQKPKQSTIKNSPKIKIVSVEANCSCEGANENCFKCNGTGFYESRIVTNIEECQDRIQEKRTQKTNLIQESQFSNDQRGGIYGIREHGRYSSNPLYEEDI